VSPDGAWTEQTKGWLEVWEWPKPGRTYVIGADSSMGLEEDDRGKSPSSSAGEVLDMETLEQVAEYDFRSAPHVFAAHLAGLGRMYNNALLAPEIQGSGGGGGREVLVYLREQYGYWHIHQWRHPDRVRRGDAVMLGWETNARTRPRMLARIREVVLENSALVHSRRLLNQILEARVRELFDYVNKEVARVGMDGALMGGVVLTGGGSSLPGMCDAAEAVLRCQARKGLPTGIAGWPEEIDDTAWACVAGLAMYSAKLKVHAEQQQQSYGFLARILSR